jgi:hypothetical protein
MEKYYIEVKWPDIQKYENNENFSEVGYDPEKNIWFVPENMIE